MLDSASQKTSASEIIESTDLNDILKFVRADGQTWIFVDLDNTVFKAQQQLGTDQWFDAEIKRRQAAGETDFQKIMAELLPIYVTAHSRSKVYPAQPDAAAVIAALQAKGVPVIGLTSRGHDYQDSDMVEPTNRQLNEIGIDLNLGPVKDIDKKLKVAYHLKHGIIFCAGHNKGECLKEVLTVLGEMPKHVIFGDDKLKNCQQVQAFCRDYGIDYTGLRYGRLDHEIASVNQNLAAIQAHYLYNILTDREARLLHVFRQTEYMHVDFVDATEDKPVRAEIWSNRKDQYDALCTLNPDLKDKFRKKPKFKSIDGVETLVFRFKVPLDVLETLLPKMKEANLLEPTQADDISSLLLSKKQSMPPILYSLRNRPVYQKSDKDKPDMQEKKSRKLKAG